MPSLLFSFSKLDSFENCKRRFYFQYVEKIPSPPNKFMQDGTRFHNMAENFHKKVDIKELLRWGADLYLEKFKIGEKWFDNFIDVEKDRYNVLLQANYPERFMPVSVERKYIGEVAGYKFIGYVDRVDRYASDEYGVLDYKPSRPRNKEAKKRLQKQLTLYAELVEAVDGIHIDNWSAYYYKDKDGDYDKIKESSRSHLRKTITKTITNMQKESDYPKCNKDYFCKYCTYKEQCKAMGDELVF